MLIFPTLTTQTFYISEVINTIKGVKMVLTEDDKKLLLHLARDAMNAELDRKDINDELIQGVKKFNLKKGVFVTLTKNNKLRGCIGQIIPILPTWQAIIEAAKSAAFHDPRFPSLDRSELPFVKIEISMLSTLEKLEVTKPEEYLDKIEIGRHGLFLESGSGNAGLLLPQVFTEHKADPLHALQMTCQKAGLPVNAWKNSDVIFRTFEAEIFREN